MGALFLVVALSYAEGTSAIPETGGAATLVRRAFNDVSGFLTGWTLFLDYLIVIALSALFLPHYVGEAIGIDALDADARRRRRRRLRDRSRSPRPARAAPRALRGRDRDRRLDLVVQLLLVVLGFLLDLLAGRAHERDRPRHGTHAGRPRLRAAARDARLHRPRDGRQPRRGDAPARTRAAAQPLRRDRRRRHRLRPRRRGRRSRPSRRTDGSTQLGTDWLRAPLLGIVDELGAELPAGSTTRCGSSSASPARSSCSPRRRRRLRLHAARVSMARTGSCRARSGG